MHAEHAGAEKVLAFSTLIESEVALRLACALLPLRATVTFLEDASFLTFNGCYLRYHAKVVFLDSAYKELQNAVTQVSQDVLEDFSLDGFSINLVRC